MKQRIWELDAFRGVCIIGVIFVHLVFDITVLYRLADWKMPTWFFLLQNWGGVLFVLLSGICVTLGKKSLLRGGVVFSCGMLITAVTFGMYKLNMAGADIVIFFGALHCLGVCMMAWAGLKRLPTWALPVIGTPMVIIGMAFYFLRSYPLPQWTQFGLLYPGGGGDYFPLFPQLGFFLLGAALGRVVYARKETLFPKVNTQNPILRFFTFCGRQSLWIYLLHQPILAGICMMLTIV